MVLATSPLQRESAVPAPLDLNIEKLVAAQPKQDFDSGVLQPLILAQKATQRAAEERKEQQQRQLEQREESQRVVQAAQASVSCVEAARATWPPELMSGATLVIERESGGRTDATHANADGSTDFGCFQINNYAHPAFFATHDWRDPYQNAAYAYQIYLGRHNFSAWYAVKGLL